MADMSDHISFKNVGGKLEVNWHVKCHECGKDITPYRVKLPPIEDAEPDRATAAFECPLDNVIEIITTADIYDELTRFNEKQSV